MRIFLMVFTYLLIGIGYDNRATQYGMEIGEFDMFTWPYQVGMVLFDATHSNVTRVN